MSISDQGNNIFCELTQYQAELWSFPLQSGISGFTVALWEGSGDIMGFVGSHIDVKVSLLYLGDNRSP